MKIKILVAILFSSFIAINPSLAIDKNTSQHKTVNGVSIYLGVLPAEIIEGTRISNMHGGLPAGQYRYHITIALFNDSGKRLDNAHISVQLATPHDTSELKMLEEMQFNKQLVYGNYFTMNETGPYRIKVIIKHPKYSKPIKSEFQYQISHASLKPDLIQKMN
ncbi:MAG: hypothetical protein ACC653_05320 [Gammaproteobacteria bacterium]